MHAAAAPPSPVVMLGKECSALVTSLSLTTEGAFRASSSDGGGRVVSVWAVGCFDFRAAMVAVLASATESSEQTRRTARLKSPSSSFTEILATIACNVSGAP